jgi:hypothetical protein
MIISNNTATKWNHDIMIIMIPVILGDHRPSL